MTKDLVSIIVPVYNVGKYLTDCFDSIKNQTYKNIEVVFINDGSTDNSLDLINNFCSQHPNAKVISQENKGISITRNNGLANASGEFVYFLDPDDMIHPQTIELFVNEINKHQSDFVCGCNKKCKEQITYNNVNWKNIKNPKTKLIDKENLIRFISGQALGTNCSIQVKLFRVSSLQKVNNFPYIIPENFSLGEDYFFITSLINVSDKAVLVKHKLHLWRQRKGSLSHSCKFNVRDLNVLKADEPFYNLEHTKTEIKAIKGKKAFHAIMVLFSMKKTKHYVLEHVEEAYKVFKENRKYFMSLKYHPFYFIFLPLSTIYFKPFLNKVRRLNKKQKNS